MRAATYSSSFGYQRAISKSCCLLLLLLSLRACGRQHKVMLLEHVIKRACGVGVDASTFTQKYVLVGRGNSKRYRHKQMRVYVFSL